MAEQLKQAVTGQEALVKSTTSGSDESLPPEYEQKLTQEKEQYFQKESGSLGAVERGEDNDDVDLPADSESVLADLGKPKITSPHLPLPPFASLPYSL